MKKIIFSLVLLTSMTIFSQKDELKVLKRLDNLEGQPTQKDMEKLNDALTSLDSMTDLLSDEDKLLYLEGKIMQPILEIMLVAMKNPNDVVAIQNASKKFENGAFLETFVKHTNDAKQLALKLGKNSEVKEIDNLINNLKKQLSTQAYQFNSNKKYKEASQAFYSLYKLDKADGSNLENAAILATQAEDYKAAQKLYEEYIASDYFVNGVRYYAINKASGNEEVFPTRDARLKAIGIGTHEKPREEKVSSNKAEIYKSLALITATNGNNDESISALEKALELNKGDKDLTDSAFRLYFNSGYDGLKDDQKLVDEINANRDNKEKYDELMAKRKELFKAALPNFEKAYQLKKDDDNTKALLKMSYEMLDMKEKAALIK